MRACSRTSEHMSKRTKSSLIICSFVSLFLCLPEGLGDEGLILPHVIDAR